MTSRPRVLLTGASGVCGRAMLEPLSGVADVTCLVHREQIADVVTVVGDVTAPGLGLAAAAYDALARNVDAIVHAAAVTGFTAPAHAVRPVNVDGTARVLELTQRADATLYHLSTAFVDWSHRSVADRAATAYEDSKIDAEELVLQSGVPAVILRPSGVIGDSRTGHIAHFQGLYLLIRAFLEGQIPVGPASANSYLDLVPQDVLADVVAGLVQRGIQDGELWITAGDTALTLQQLAEECVDYAREQGRPVDMPKFVSNDTFERLIRPVFLPALPARMRATITRVLEAFTNFNVERPFPTSLPELRDRLDLGELPDWRASFRRSLEYWGRVKGFAEADRAARL